MNIRTCARALVVLLQMIALPIYADFNPTNPPEPNITYKLIVGATPAGSAYTSGSGNFREGEIRRVSASPYSNYKLLYWTINGYRYHETSTSFYYTMGDSAVTLIAHFEYVEPTPPPFEPSNPPEPYIKQYVTVDIDPAEGGTTSGSGSYTNGEKVTVRANLDTDYEFQSWTINGYPWSATTNSFIYTVADTNAHFVAHVAKKHMITLKTNPRAAGTSTMKMNGIAIGNQLVANGKNIDFSTIGNEDYVFNHWAINGYKHTTATSFRYTVGDSAAAVVAMYDYIGTGDTTMFNPDNPPEPDLRYDVTIIVIPDNEEKGSTEGGGTYVYGTIDTLYAYPAEGFAFRYWNDGITDNPRIITATQDSLFIAYFGNDTAVWNDTICYGEYLQVGDSILYESGHYEFYTPRPDGLFTWNIVNLTVWHEMSTRLEATICFDDTLDYEGRQYFETGVYVDSILNEFGCDSIVIVDLTVLPKIEPSFTYDTIQPGDTYEWNGEIYTSSGYYTKTLTSINGCDSLDILHLYVEAPITVVHDTICEGETYYLTIHGVIYSMQSDTIMQVFGPEGEEYVYVYLHKLPAIPETVIDATICEGEPFYWNGKVYYSSTHDTVLLSSQHGCDSIVILNLMTNPSNATSVDLQTICEGDSYCWYVTGECFTKDTIVYYTDECNNSYTLDLTVRKSAVSLDDTIYVVEGSNYSWHGNVYTTSGHYTTTLQDEFGCEYTANLYLTYVADVAWDSFCEGSVYTWDGHFTNNATTPLIFSESGTYLDTIVGAYGEEYIYVLYLDKVAKPVLTTCSDTTIQLGDSVLLWATGADYIHWTSDDYLTQTDELSYYAKPKVTTTYTVTGYNLASGKGANVVYNGNFDDGNVGFYSDCSYMPPYESSGSIGEYTVADDIRGFWPSFSSVKAYGDKGNMMILDGKTTVNSVVWQQTVNVKPHTYYAFSAQVMSVHDSYMEGRFALLQFNVDEEDIGPIFHSPDVLYEWREFYNMWYSGEKTTVTLTIYNQNDNLYGNDFAIDEISLIELQTTCQDEKSVTVTVNLPSLVDTVVCSSQIPFEWNGMIVDSAGVYQTYLNSSTGIMDSVATMIVSIKESSDTTLNYTICYGEAYEGIPYFADTTFIYYLNNINGCDSIIYMHLTVLPEDIQIDYDTICEGESYSWNGMHYKESGIHPFSYTNQYGCEAWRYLHLHVMPNVAEVIDTITACDSFVWNGKVYTTSGIYHDTLTTDNGCNSIATLHLTVNNSIVNYLSETACDNYLWQTGEILTKSGVYYDTLMTAHGCDSILVLDLTINHSTVGTPEEYSICYGDSLTWNRVVYYSTGIYSCNLTNAAGCDSTAYLQLTILPKMVVDSSHVTICPSELPYIWYGDTLNAAGTYIYREPFHLNTFCDSIEHVLTLNVLENASSDATVVACDSYTWNGVTYTASGDYIYTTTATNGCDSIATLHLTINNSVSSDEYATICYGEAYFWNNIWCNTTDTYSMTMTSSKGCDSIVNLHLTVLPELERIEEWAEVCYGESYTWYGKTYTKSGTYSETYKNENDCEGMAYLYLTVKSKLPTQDEWVEICYGDSYTWNGITYTQSGDYKSSYVDDDGCTGEKILHLTVWPKSPAIEEWATITNGDTYTWNGGNYDTEGTYTLSTYDEHGCPQDMILHLDVQTLDFTVNIAEHCANDPYIDFDIQSDMIMDKLQFQFDASGLWRDTVVYSPGQYVSIPNNARAGVYNVVISAYAEGRYLGTKTQEYTLLYPSSVLDQHWDDFIGVLTHNYNGGYDFVSFQWYKNNEPIKDENKSYLSQPLEMGEMYSAMLEDVNGLKLMTCPIVATHQEELYLYPSLAEPKQQIRIRTSHPAMIEMYSITGTQLLKAEYESGENMLEAPNTSGIYIVKVIYHDNTNKMLTRKITIR